MVKRIIDRGEDKEFGQDDVDKVAAILISAAKIGIRPNAEALAELRLVLSVVEGAKSVDGENNAEIGLTGVRNGRKEIEGVIGLKKMAINEYEGTDDQDDAFVGEELVRLIEEQRILEEQIKLEIDTYMNEPVKSRLSPNHLNSASNSLIALKLMLGKVEMASIEILQKIVHIINDAKFDDTGNITGLNQILQLTRTMPEMRQMRQAIAQRLLALKRNENKSVYDVYMRLDYYARDQGLTTFNREKNIKARLRQIINNPQIDNIG